MIVQPQIGLDVQTMALFGAQLGFADGIFTQDVGDRLIQFKTARGYVGLGRRRLMSRCRTDVRFG